MRDTAARTERIKELFAQAMPLDPAARVAMLERECDDASLRKAVSDLLDDYDSAQQFFAQFPDNFARNALGLATTPPVFSVGDLVAGRFRIVGFLGAGGMGEVYEAEDQLLNLEHVALKTLPAEVSRDARAIEQLKRELALARKVTHPNVCRVFDVDQHMSPSGTVIAFFTMEVLKGETLAVRLERTGPMSTTEAHPFVTQMAAALSAAHAAGILHGDFKPGNVVLVPSRDETERLVVTDFGLARRDSAAHSANTSAGAWGTPLYMAPEQFAGRRPTRATDVYALAAVVLEMVTGKRPAERDAADVRALDLSWRMAIARGLQHDPAARFDTVADFLRALTARPSASRRRWPLAAGATALLLALLLVSPVGEQLRATIQNYWAVPAAARQNVVVLPFTATTGAPASVTLARGVSAAIADHLRAAAAPDAPLLFVPIAAAVADAVNTPAQAHRMLGADLIVTGTVDDARPTRVALELHRAAGPQIVLDQHRRVEVRDDERLLPLVRNEVAGLLALRLASASTASLDANGTGAAATERQYLLGRGYLEQGRPPQGDVTRLQQAVAALQRAIAVASQHAAAHAALAEALVLQYDATKNTRRDTQLLDSAERSAAEASRLQPRIAQFHVVRAQTYLATGRHVLAIPALEEALRLDRDAVIARELLARSYEATSQLPLAERTLNEGIAAHPRYWGTHEDLGALRLNHGDYKEAERHFLAGRQYAPDNTRVINNLAVLYTMTEQFDAAEQEIRRGLALAPSLFLYNNLGWAYFYQEKFAEGTESLEQATRLSRDSMGLAGLARGYRWMAREDEAREISNAAIAAALREIAAQPSNVEVRANLAYLYAETGNRGEAIRLIARALDDAPQNVRVRFTSALVFEVMGRRQDALESLAAAIDGGHPMYQIAHHPDLRALRTDPGYVELISRTTSRRR